MKMPKANLVDRAIEVFAPRIAARRMQARMALAVASGYHGARRDRPGLGAWNPLAGDANADTLSDLPTLRARTRDLARNAPLAGAALNAQVTHVVGTGLSLQALPDSGALSLTDDEAREWADNTEREWRLLTESPDCDVTRTQNFYALTALAFRSAIESGDCLALLPFVSRPGRPYKLAVQIVEADRLCNPDWKADTDKIMAGIELGSWGEPIAYHVCDKHPGALGRIAGAKWTRVVAFGSSTGRRNAIHLFDRRRPGQIRGIPCLAPVIEPLKQLQRYTDAELQSAVINAAFAVFVKMDAEAFDTLFDDTGKGEYLKSATQWDGTIAEAGLDKPGRAINLLPGESVENAAPGRPNALFDPFVQAIVRQVGATLEIPFEVLIKHYTASYSAARAALLDAWRFFRGRRDWLADAFCQPIYEAFLDEAVSLGRITAPGWFSDPAMRKAWSTAAWIGDGPGSIDPVKEVDAAEKRIAIGISTRAAESILHDGGDWRAKHKQLAIEEAARREDGLGQQAPATAIEPDEDDAEDKTEDARDTALIALASKPAAPVHVHLPPSAIHNHIPEPNVAVTVSPPDVSVSVEARMPDQPAPNVTLNVEPTPVTLEATIQAAPAPNVTLNVEPTPVTLEATLQAAPAQVVVSHPASARQTYERDPNTQEIIASVTKYEAVK